MATNGVFHSREMVTAVIHRGIQYTIAATAEPDIWRWRFQIGDSVRTGRTQTRLAELAARRVQSKIDTALRALASPSAREAAIAPDCGRDEPELDVL